MCYMEPDCVSINLYTRADGNGNYKCELNNATHEGHEGKLIEQEMYVYHAAEGNCVENPCKNNATCQSGFTKKGFRCLCIAGFEGPICEREADFSNLELSDKTKTTFIISRTVGGLPMYCCFYSCWCVYVFFFFLNDNLYLVIGVFLLLRHQRMFVFLFFLFKRSNVSGVVTLLVDSQPLSVFCSMGNFGCGDGGWTPVMKIDGRETTFHYDEHYWINYQGYNLPGGETGFDGQESKLPTYWNTSFKICLGMKIDSSDSLSSTSKLTLCTH
ncbi:unnamed protein product [Pocillopora meandrina]|uniref:EGF-like domain-containing protein n=1 Tax=Pocillopora meandrina TaxID=46732 RepID=A0AAU9XXG7_9CNID|nr:unnamed protein product [Pocillopora meandrina]